MKPAGDRARRKVTQLRLVGTTDAYGEIEIWVGSGVATVTGVGVPGVEIRHPGKFESDLLPIDEQTVLAVDGVPAVLMPGSGRSKTDRAARIELNERKYTLIATERSTEELRGADGTTLVRVYRPFGLKPSTVSTSTNADATDLAVGLALLALDPTKLTTTRAALKGVFNKVFNSGTGEPG
ncbi:hypothetical protein OG474_13450 [Kribbella sp. NBC_01505]|uniref:hypothetical protein n=1 Tax=Kribbella sp. NBC_01505 TaxID=2903580 RepID=UPI003866022C